MDIYILQNGEETGPFSLETTRVLLKQGTVAEADFAWRPGMPKWLPLSELLATEPVPTPVVPVEKAPDSKPDPATAKQKAFLSYFGIPIAADLTRDQAALLVNDTMEESANSERLAHWNEERLRLHPELFAAEIQARKENRPNHFFELCQTSGAKYFTGVVKAHCQVLVGFLDVKFPNWDAKESEAAENYFFPAVAEKFPQLVNKEWRGRMRYADGTKISPEIAHKSPTSKLRRTTTSPIAAIARGLVLGVVILGALYLGHRTLQTDTIAAPSPAETSPAPVVAVAEEKVAVAPAVAPAPATEPAPVAPQALPPIEPVAPIAQTEPAPATPAPAAVPMAPAPAAPVATPPMETAVATAPMAGNAAPPMAANAPDPAMAPMAPTAPVATLPSAVDTAPMAALPGKEPPVPVAPPAATMPVAGTLPSTPPADPAAAPAVPAPNDFAASVPPLPVASQVKTNLLLTKPVEVALAYGKIMLAPGTPVKLVSRQGALLKVSYQNRVITVPAGSTDVE